MELFEEKAEQVLTEPLDELMSGVCANAYVKASELAEKGNTKRWGGSEDSNVH